MKKLFNIIGIISLVIISFVYTEKTTMVVREYDDIMINIKKQKNIEKIDSIIVEDTIIPGILERKINIDESYMNMKKLGYYKNELLVYEKIDNKNSLKNHLDKYIISGNKSKNMVSIIFDLDWNSNINKILEIIEENNIEVSFAVNDEWINSNNELLNEISKKHTILIKEKNNFNWVNMTIKKVLKKQTYCFTNEKDEDLLNICKNKKINTILPLEINNYLIETKKNLTSGVLLSYKVNSNLENNLDMIIKYIKNRGYTISNIVEHLEE